MALKLVALAISTLGYLAFLVSVLKIRPLLTPLVWISFVTTFVYAFGIAGHLALGANLALALGIALGLATAWLTRHHLPKPCSDWLWALPYLIPLVVAYRAIPHDFVFLVWDEVGTWAKTQKLVFDTNSLLTADSPIAIKSYPPGQIVFQYYLTRMTWWSEKHVLFAQILFVFCALMGTVGALVSRKGWAAIVYLTLIPVIYFFHFDYTTIYADPLLAVMFAACLALALRPRAREGLRDDLVLAACLCGFVLLKDMAVVFTALVVAIYVVNIAIGAERASSPPARAGQAGMAVLICGLAVGLVLRSWKWYVSTIDTSTTSFSPISIDSFTQEAFLARFGKTVTAFIHQLLKPEYFASDALLGRFGGSLAQVMTALVLLGLVITAVAAGRRRVVAFIATQAIFAGAIGYLLFLLWLYLAFFTEYEGVRVASFERYSMTYLLAWLLVKDYDYLAIYHADDRFWNDNRAIFSAAGQDRESGVYKISRRTDGSLELSPAQ